MGFDKEYMTLSVQTCSSFFDVIEMCKNNSHLASIICSHEGKKVINFYDFDRENYKCINGIERFH